MSIPLYFAMNEEEISNAPPCRPAQLGFGFTPEGDTRLPERLIPKAPAIINDLVMPEAAPSDRALDALAECCSAGCILDFERPVTEVHIEIAVELTRRLAAPPVMPTELVRQAGFGLPLTCPGEPKNSWETYCQTVENLYPTGWYWEVIPWNRRRRLPFPVSAEGHLPHAACDFEASRGMVSYYDTETDIRKKLATAEKYGCMGAVGLAIELTKLKK